MKHTHRKFYTLSIFFFLFVGLATSASMVGAFSLFGSSLERVNTKGAVSISAIPLTDDTGKNGELSFHLTLNTHSVRLDDYDIRALSFVSIDNGPATQAASWSPSGAGHHLQGTLRFASPLADTGKNLQLTVKGIAGVQERIFTWKLPIQE